MSDDRCPQCDTDATYQLAENSFACKCTYEFELEIERSIDEIVAMVKQVRKEMAEQRQKYNETAIGLTEGGQK